MQKKTFLISALFTALMLVSAQSFAREMQDEDIVVLRTIDKVSAYTHTFEIPVGKTVKFGSSLFIKARACRKASPIDTPEDAAFLQIWQRKPHEETPTWVYSGWMFSSNPSISGIEHPVYDVWVIACKNERTSASDADFTSETSPDEKQVPDTQSDAPAEDNGEDTTSDDASNED